MIKPNWNNIRKEKKTCRAGLSVNALLWSDSKLSNLTTILLEKKKYTIRSIVCEASCHPVTKSFSSVTRALGHLVTWSLGHLSICSHTILGSIGMLRRQYIKQKYSHLFHDSPVCPAVCGPWRPPRCGGRPASRGRAARWRRGWSRAASGCGGASWPSLASSHRLRPDLVCNNAPTSTLGVAVK